MRKLVSILALTALAVLAADATLVACSSATLDASSSPGDSGYGSDASGRDGAAFADGGAPIVPANGVVLLHAASFPAFRLCFQEAPAMRPLPDSDVLPNSNVVGVDVGAAVRLPPMPGALGQAFVFPEPALRPFYPAFGGAGAGPTCGELLASNGAMAEAIAVGTIDIGLGEGVHALVLTGCRGKAHDPQAGAARCGQSWTEADGNLALRVVSLTAYGRQSSTSGIPVQLIQLSSSLATRSAGRALGLAFGPLTGDGGVPDPFLEGAVPFGTPVPTPPARLTLTSSELDSYATSGIFVTLGGEVDEAGAPLPAAADAGPRELVFKQSLEDVQRLSAPRSLPTNWFAVESSYVLVSLGESDPRTPDGGSDPDERRALHLLAIPLAPGDGG